MLKNKIKYTFRSINGLWRRVDSQEPQPLILADFLKEHEIIVDDRTQFTRLYDYEKNICIEYRANNLAKVVITIYNNSYE